MIFYPMCQCYYCRQQNFVLCFFQSNHIIPALILLQYYRTIYRHMAVETYHIQASPVLFWNCKNTQILHDLVSATYIYFLYIISIQRLSDAHTDRGTDAGNDNTLSALGLRLKTHPTSDILNLQRNNPRYLSITPFLYQNGCINSWT